MPPVYNHVSWWELSRACISEHHREQNDLGMTDHHSFTQGQLSTGKTSAGGGSTAMNGPADIGVTLQGNFHIINSPY